MESVEKLATPALADTVVVPDSEPEPGLLPSATGTLAVELVTVFPNWSCTVTCTAGAIATPAVSLDGWTVKANRLAAAWVMLKPFDVSPANEPDAAVNV